MPPSPAATYYKTIAYAQIYRWCTLDAPRYDRHRFGHIRTWTLYCISRLPSHGKSFHTHPAHFRGGQHQPYRRPGRFRIVPDYAVCPAVEATVRCLGHSYLNPTGVNRLPHTAQYALRDRTGRSSIPVLSA